MMADSQVRRCTVYGGQPEAGESSAMEHRGRLKMGPRRIAADSSVRTIMSQELICAAPDLDISAVVGLMMQHRVGCLPVVDGRGRPLGVVTKLDLVEQLDAAMRASNCGYLMPTDLAAQTADDVMTPLALTLRDTATVADAALMMKFEDTHHVLVVDPTGSLVGVVSAKDVATWVLTPELLEG